MAFVLGSFFVSVCWGLVPVSCAAVSIPASARWLLSSLPLYGLYLHFYQLGFVSRLEFCSILTTFMLGLLHVSQLLGLLRMEKGLFRIQIQEEIIIFVLLLVKEED